MENKLFDELEVLINGEIYNFDFGEHFPGFNEDIARVTCEKEFPTGMGLSGNTTIGYYRVLGNYVADNVCDYHRKYEVKRIINPTEYLTTTRKNLIKRYRNANIKCFKERFDEFRKMEEKFGIPNTSPLDVDIDGNILIYGEKTTDLCEIANAITHLKVVI